MKLDEIAQIMLGVFAQRENDERGENSYLLFSLKNYEEKQTYETLKTNKDLSQKLIQQGDLLFRLLYPNKIIYVDETLQGMLHSSQFCVIRTQKEKMNPIVLKWYLESRIAQTQLEERITGSIIKSMSISNLKGLEIPKISLRKQEEMEKLIVLWEKEKEISKQIMEEKEKLYHYYLEEMVEKGENCIGDSKTRTN